jgi:hypothetical protein
MGDDFLRKTSGLDYEHEDSIFPGSQDHDPDDLPDENIRWEKERREILHTAAFIVGGVILALFVFMFFFMLGVNNP